MSSEALTDDRPTTLEPGSRPAAPADVLDAVTALAPEISARAPEIERERRVPPDLLERLRQAGCFDLLLPESHGGLGADLVDTMRVLDALARADGSVGWTVMIGTASWIDLAGLPRASFDEIVADPGDRITAGAINPSGSIEPVGHGYRVSGRWGFASGCNHARWLFGNCLEGFVDGEPQLRIVVVDPTEAVIEDTWHVVGLCGTGSHHFRIDDVVVPAERTVTPMHVDPCIDAPIVRVSPVALFSTLVASVALGIAQGALDEVIALSKDKVPLFASGSLDADPTFRIDLARAATEVEAARAQMLEIASSLWESGRDDTPLTLDARARTRASAVHASERAAAAVDAAYRSGGGSALYLASPLQRRLRDIHALTQHFLVRHDTLVTAGGILAGSTEDPGLF
jgi:alkylation response protein AidB-like acyl-CoA dehydrogenase